jgi:hypothetical protein
MRSYLIWYLQYISYINTKMKNPFKEGDHVVVTNRFSANNGYTGYVCEVGQEIVYIKSTGQSKEGYHYTNLDFADKKDRKPMEEETRNESVWCIFKDKGDAPKKMHMTYDAAKAELERIAKASPGHKFYLLEAIEELTYEMKYERKELKYNNYPQEPEENTVKS